MYVAAMNYMSNEGMVKAGETVKNPSPDHIKKGLVKEVKVIDAKEVKKTKTTKAKTKKEEK